MNGRCHNDLMDFAHEVCDSCGEQFCESCLVHPRGPKGPPFCTYCAMALSGVRNRRPIKPLGRSEIKKRRKALKVQLSEQEDIAPRSMPGTDLIEGPSFEGAERRDTESTGIMSRFRRRKTDQSADPIEGEAPEFRTTVAGQRGGPSGNSSDGSTPGSDDSEGDDGDSVGKGTPEPTSATALLNQLREQEAMGEDEDVWLPSVPDDENDWDAAPAQQSPLGQSGPWGSVATPAEAPAGESGEVQGQPKEASELANASPPSFVTEAELRSQGPADKDQSGAWVPPSLRGMAPSAGSNGSELTKRRRRPEDQQVKGPSDQ